MQSTTVDSDRIFNLFWYLLPKRLSDPPRVSQSGVELEKILEYDFMVSEDAHGSYKPYGRVRLTFGPL